MVRRASRGGGVIRITRGVRVAGAITNTVVVTALLVGRGPVSVGAGEATMRNTGVNTSFLSCVSAQYSAYTGAGVIARHRGGTAQQATTAGRSALSPAARLLVRLRREVGATACLL